MELPKEIIPLLVPEGLPALDVVGVENQASLIEDPLYNRSYRWSIAILYQTFAKITSSLNSEPIISLSAGFVAVGHVLLNDMAYSNFPIQQSFTFGGHVIIKGFGESRIEIIVIDEKPFPILFTYGDFILHGNPTHPHTGNSACWVRSLPPNPGWNYGILTCRHVVSAYSIGSGVGLSPSSAHSTPGAGTLVDWETTTIDAAIIEIPATDWPASATALPVKNPVAPGMSVDIQLGSGLKSGSILRIFQNPSYYGSLFGQRVFIDCHGAPGDSGSLVFDSTNHAVGLYMGMVPDNKGGYEGVCQDMMQVTKYFNIECFY